MHGRCAAREHEHVRQRARPEHGARRRQHALPLEHSRDDHCSSNRRCRRLTRPAKREPHKYQETAAQHQPAPSGNYEHAAHTPRRRGHAATAIRALGSSVPGRLAAACRSRARSTRVRIAQPAHPQPRREAAVAQAEGLRKSAENWQRPRRRRASERTRTYGHATTLSCCQVATQATCAHSRGTKIAARLLARVGWRCLRCWCWQARAKARRGHALAVLACC